MSHLTKVDLVHVMHSSPLLPSSASSRLQSDVDVFISLCVAGVCGSLFES